jgi:hypothetical protein
MRETEVLSIEEGGWVRWIRTGRGIPNVRIRFEPDRGGRLVGREVHIADEDGLRAEVLRQIPLGRLERWANRADVAAAVRERIEGATAEPSATPWQRVGPRVAVPDRRGRAPYPTSFYERVARVVSAGHSARAIAEASGVPATTVARWIKGARARGFLAPSRAEGEGS